VKKLGSCIADKAAGAMLLVNAYGTAANGATGGYVMKTLYSHSTVCNGTVSSSSYYPTGKCPSTWTPANGKLLVYSVAATVPTPPTNDIAVYDYASAATCAATDASQIVGATFLPYPPQYTQTAKCYNSFANNSASGAYANNRNYCGPRAFVASSTAPSGGFIITRLYSVRLVVSSHYSFHRLT
jgi:hypothetical protein